MLLRLLPGPSALVIALLLSACGGSDNRSATVVPSAAAPTTQASPTASPPQVTFAAPGPAAFSVIAGQSSGAVDIERFMPYDIHVREGDSIEWTSHGIEGHTVTFGDQATLRRIMSSYLVPDTEKAGQQVFNPDLAFRSRTGDTFAGDGTYFNSGFFGVPVEQKYKLTFVKRGVYEYLCLVHPLWMRGTVSVDAPDAKVESPETVSQRGTTDLHTYMEEEKRALANATAERRDVPGPGGTTLHRVGVGVVTPYGQVAAFVTPALKIKAGDTVIFESDERNFHNVVFKGDRTEAPPGYAVRVDPEGRGINVALDQQSAAAVEPPPEGFDDKAFLSSGTMGPSMPRSTWRLTFDKAGTYLFSCTLHVFGGMAGVITVE
jgi:plastocyanin